LWWWAAARRLRGGGRLSEDSKTSVALLEAGKSNDNWVVTTPGALVLMVPGKAQHWAFDTVPQAGLNGRIGYQPRARGSAARPRSMPWSISAATAQTTINGPRSAIPAASFADVLPYFKRSEDNADFDGEYHGKGGPLPVNKLRTDNPVQQTFLQAAREAQFRIREDFNGEDHEGLGIYQVTQRTANAGARHGPMSIRTWPRAPICGSKPMRKASRILFEGKRAVGVEYRQGDETKQNPRPAARSSSPPARSRRRIS